MALDKITTDIIADDAVTAAKIVAGAVEADIRVGGVTGTQIGYFENATATQNLTGTYSTQRMYLNDSYTLTGDVTLSGHLALGSVAEADIVITNDSTARTITGNSGVLVAGGLLVKESKDLTGMTGELGSAVTVSASTGALKAMQVFETSGTWTKLTGTNTIKVYVTGGGGGSSSSDDTYKGSGAAGGTAIKVIDVTSISSVYCTVGTGGLGTKYGVAAPLGSDAYDGSTSSFGSHCSATGGQGMKWWDSGKGGTGVDGDINLKGQGSSMVGAYANFAPCGGDSFWGGGGRGPEANAVGDPWGQGFHGSGAGAWDEATVTWDLTTYGVRFSGGDGIIVIEEYS